MLWMFQRVNYGPLTNEKNRRLPDLSPREWVVIAPICAMAIVMGVVPGVFLAPMEPSVRKTIQHVIGTSPVMADAETSPEAAPRAVDAGAPAGAPGDGTPTTPGPDASGQRPD
jgi:NADH-quinone oxidoreductase subunit M